MSHLERVNDEVFLSRDPIVRIGMAEVEFIKMQAAKNRRKRARICAHQSVNDSLHEMLIAISSNSYIHPHKHLENSESFHIIEGEVDVVLFDDTGAVAEVVELGPVATEKSFYYRLATSTFHTLLIQTEFLVVHEATSGPFSRERTILADWAPAESSVVEVTKYMKQLRQAIKIQKLSASRQLDIGRPSLRPASR